MEMNVISIQDPKYYLRFILFSASGIYHCRWTSVKHPQAILKTELFDCLQLKLHK